MNLYIGGYLSTYTSNNQSKFKIDLQEPKQLSALIQELEVPLELAAIIVIDGKICKLQNLKVNNDDDVFIYPSMDGG